MKSDKWRNKMVLKFTKQIMQQRATPIDGLLTALDLVRQLSRLTMAPSSYDMLNVGLAGLLNLVAENENLGKEYAEFAKEVIDLRPDWFSQEEIDAINAAVEERQSRLDSLCRENN